MGSASVSISRRKWPIWKLSIRSESRMKSCCFLKLETITLRQISQTQKDTLSCLLSSVDLRSYTMHPIYLISLDLTRYILSIQYHMTWKWTQEKGGSRRGGRRRKERPWGWDLQRPDTHEWNPFICAIRIPPKMKSYACFLCLTAHPQGAQETTL